MIRGNTQGEYYEIKARWEICPADNDDDAVLGGFSEIALQLAQKIHFDGFQLPLGLMNEEHDVSLVNSLAALFAVSVTSAWDNG